MTEPTTVEGILIVGQRRPPGSTGPFGGGGGGLGEGGMNSRKFPKTRTPPAAPTIPA